MKTKTAEEILRKYRLADYNKAGVKTGTYSLQEVDAIKAMEEYASLKVAEAKEDKLTDKKIKESIPYPNAISRHQIDINIGWMRALKAYRDGLIHLKLAIHKK